MRSNKESGKPDRFGPGCRDHRAHIVRLELCWTCSPATSLAHVMLALLNRASRSEAALATERERLCEPYAPAASKTRHHEQIQTCWCRHPRTLPLYDKAKLKRTNVWRKQMPAKEALVFKRSIPGWFRSNQQAAVMSPSP